jgi:protein ImuB
LDLIKPRESYGEVSDLEHPVEMLEPLLFLLRRFLEQICTRLAGAYLVAGRLRIGLRFEARAPYERIFTIPQPTRDPGILFRILHTHLENFRADSAIMAVELAAKPVRPGAKQTDLLDRGLRDPQQFTETLGRLQALLGTEEVGSPELQASHHPEAFRVCPYDPDAPVPQGNDLLIGVPWMRFQPPVPASVVVEGQRPAHLRSSRSTGPVRDARGPWKASGEWWEISWAREEWDIATSDGLFRLVLAGGNWFLDGIYA